MFPSPERITIRSNTENVTFICSQCLMIHFINQNKLTIITTLPYNIPVLSEENEGIYMLVRETASEVQYITASVHIEVDIPTVPSTRTLMPNVTKMHINETSNNSLIIITIIIVLLIVVTIIILIIVMVPIIVIIFFMRRRRYQEVKDDSVKSTKKQLPSKKPRKIQTSADGYSELPISSEANLRDKEYIELGPPISSQSRTKQIQVTGDRDYVRMDRSNSDEGYTPMSSVIKENTLPSKSISARDFPNTYKLYVDSGIGNDSKFFVEFKELNEQTKNVLSESEYTKFREHVSHKNILFPDENRVILESQYFKCNYINASWLENYEYIATIHPTDKTKQDFLQMIFQTKASMVIMLTTRQERAKILTGVSNRMCYWPKKDEPLICQPFESNLISCTETTAFVKQEISLKNTVEGKEHSFIHCVSPIWNEDCTVSDMAWVVTLLNRIVKQKKDSPYIPIIIHCPDGISKTGIIMTALNSVKEMTSRNTINIFDVVKNLRRQRMKMVPTLGCYRTCYSLMNEYCSIHL
ncbi:RyPTPR4a [Oopsacas minuta]|uniref:RyPTPR4a n=1 Tax=Oopsacas minuta TaxID=111878 RepID=A0AAV7KJT6_9METZ|nr:RyPTPR4a [Oopsacas minuta]